MKQTPKMERRMTRLQARLSAAPQNPSNGLSNTLEDVKSPSSEEVRSPNAGGAFMNTAIDNAADRTISVTTIPIYWRKHALNSTAQHESYKKCKTNTAVHASPMEAKVADSHPKVDASKPMQPKELNVAENFEEGLGKQAFKDFLHSEGHSRPKNSLVKDHLSTHVQNYVESLFSTSVPVASSPFPEAKDYNVVEWRAAGVSDMDDIVIPSNVCPVNTEAFPSMVAAHNVAGVSDMDDIVIPSNVCLVNTEAFPSMVAAHNGTVAVPSSNVPSINPTDALPHAPNGTTSDQGQVQMGSVTVTLNAVEGTPQQNTCDAMQESGNPSKSFCTGLTEMMNMGAGEDTDEDEVEYCPLVRVHGYKVKEEWAYVLTSIIDKHGDIAADCNMTSQRFRSTVLEELCRIVEKGRAKKFGQITQDEIEEALVEISDVGKTGMCVSWLQERLEDILEAKQLVKDSNLRGNLQKLNEVIGLMEKEMEVHKARLKLAEEKRDAARTEDAKLKRSISKAKCLIRQLIKPLDGLL